MILLLYLRSSLNKHVSCIYPFCMQSLHQGVERDLERQRKKRQNQLELEEQIALTKKLTEQRDRDKQSMNHPS